MPVTGWGRKTFIARVRPCYTLGMKAGDTQVFTMLVRGACGS
jgi:hypothetical protein